MATLSPNGKTIDLNKVRLYTEPTGAIRMTCNDSELDKPLSLVFKSGSTQEQIASELFAKLKEEPEIELRLGLLNGRKSLPVTLGLNGWKNPLMWIQGGPASGKTTLLTSMISQVREQFDEADMRNSLRCLDASGGRHSEALDLSFKKMVDGVHNKWDCKIILFIHDSEYLNSKDLKILTDMMTYAQNTPGTFLRVFMTRSAKGFAGFEGDTAAEAVLHLTRKGEPGFKYATGTLHFDDDPIENIITEL